MTKEEAKVLAKEYSEGLKMTNWNSLGDVFLQAQYGFEAGFNYADQQTTSLKAEVESLQSQLAEKEKELAFYNDASATVTNREKVFSSQSYAVSKITSLESQLAKAEADKVELLEKHRKDVMEAFNTGIFRGEYYGNRNAEDYYKDKFESK